MKVEQLKAELVVFKGLMSNVSPSPLSDPAAASYPSGGAVLEEWISWWGMSSTKGVLQGWSRVR